MRNSGLRMVGVEEAGPTQAGMVLEDNAAALRIEHRVRDVAKAVQRVAPVLTCFFTQPPTTQLTFCGAMPCDPMLFYHLLNHVVR